MCCQAAGRWSIWRRSFRQSWMAGFNDRAQRTGDRSQFYQYCGAAPKTDGFQPFSQGSVGKVPTIAAIQDDQWSMVRKRLKSRLLQGHEPKHAVYTGGARRGPQAW